MKKLLAVLLAAVMLLGIAVPSAFAAESGKKEPSPNENKIRHVQSARHGCIGRRNCRKVTGLKTLKNRDLSPKRRISK